MNLIAINKAPLRGDGSPNGENKRNEQENNLLRQCKVSITFKEPILGKDLQDGAKYLSTKHWIIAELMEYDLYTARFVTYENEIVAEWPSSEIIGLSIPQLDEETPVVMAQKSLDYQLEIKQQRPNAWSKWTPDEEQQLKAEFDAGMSLDEIADIHHRTPVAISERLYRIGIYSHEPPKLGARTEKRYYKSISPWMGHTPQPGEVVTVCLGCGYRIHSRPCMCWTHSDTSNMVTWREWNHQYTMFGSRIWGT